MQVPFLSIRKDQLDSLSAHDDYFALLVWYYTPVFRKFNDMRKFKSPAGNLCYATVLWVVVLTVINGCSASNYGRLASNPEVTKAFQTYQILPDHTYYYRGSFSRPFVIAGIHKNFILDSPLWVEIDTNSQDFRTLVGRVSLQGMGNPIEPWGFSILDKGGRKVGVWFSAIRAAAVDVDESGRIVQLAPIGTVTRGNQRQ